MYTDTVTVFNKKKTASGDMWYPFLIFPTQLLVDRAANQAKTGLVDAAVATLNIRYRTCLHTIIIADKQYCGPKEWESLEQVDGYFTFIEGESFFIKGEYPQDPVSDDDYPVGFYEYMNQTYDDCYLVSSVAAYGLIPHFEIGGK